MRDLRYRTTLIKPYTLGHGNPGKTTHQRERVELRSFGMTPSAEISRRSQMRFNVVCVEPFSWRAKSFPLIEDCPDLRQRFLRMCRLGPTTLNHVTLNPMSLNPGPNPFRAGGNQLAQGMAFLFAKFCFDRGRGDCTRKLRDHETAVPARCSGTDLARLEHRGCKAGFCRRSRDTQARVSATHDREIDLNVFG